MAKSAPTKSMRWMSKIGEIAPILSIAVLLLVPKVLPHDPQHAMVFGPEQQLVADAVAALPFRVGQWAGRDVPVPEAAVRLLRPNAMLSRRFVHLESGVVIDLTIVHCGDARDMLGHYPPICYPSAGWVREESSRTAEGEIVELTFEDLRIEAYRYRFSRIRDMGETVGIQVINFFVLPNGEITPHIEDVSRRTNWLGASVHGVAQVQLLLSEAVPVDRAVQSANDLLVGMSDIFDALGVRRPGMEEAADV